MTLSFLFFCRTEVVARGFKLYTSSRGSLLYWMGFGNLNRLALIAYIMMNQTYSESHICTF